jgi:hypothetical protein
LAWDFSSWLASAVRLIAGCGPEAQEPAHSSHNGPIDRKLRMERPKNAYGAPPSAPVWEQRSYALYRQSPTTIGGYHEAFCQARALEEGGGMSIFGSLPRLS